MGARLVRSGGGCLAESGGADCGGQAWFRHLLRQHEHGRRRSRPRRAFIAAAAAVAIAVAVAALLFSVGAAVVF